MTIDSKIFSKRLLVVAGTGGVGKTSISASLGVFSALLGKSTLVITMDPAKRLSQALSETTSSNSPGSPVDLTLQLASVPRVKNNLCPVSPFFALTPNIQYSFNSMIERIAPNLSFANKVKTHPFLQSLVSEYSGANEYLALERLHYAFYQTDFQTIVLDTPPSSHTLDFIEAPQNLIRFFKDPRLRWFVPNSESWVKKNFDLAIKAFKMLTGSQFLSQFEDFTELVWGLREKLEGSLVEAMQLLKAPDTAILSVATPQSTSSIEIINFFDKTKTQGYPSLGVILNKSLVCLQDSDLPMPPLVKEFLNDELAWEEKLSEAKIPVLSKIPWMTREPIGLEGLIEISQFF